MNEVPRDWKIVSLQDVTQVILGQSPPGTSYNEAGIGFPFFQGKAEFGTLHPEIKKWTTQGTKIAEPGDVLVSVRAPVGPTNVALEKCVIGRGLAALRAGPSIHPMFLLWAMRATESALAKQATGTTFAAVTGATVKKHLIPVPPLDEQQRIVATLEAHLSRLDVAEKSVDFAFGKASALQTAILSKGFRSPSNSGLADRRVRIGDVGIVKGGKRLPRGTPWSQCPTEHRYIRATDIKDGGIETSNLVYVPAEVWPAISRYVVATGDVLVTIAGTIGSVAEVPESLNGANLTENAAKISVDDQVVTPSYLKYFLLSPEGSQQMNRLSRATTQAKLALYRIQQIEMPLPTVERQRKTVAWMESTLTDLHRVGGLRESLSHHSNTLRRALLQSAFSGRLTKESTLV